MNLLSDVKVRSQVEYMQQLCKAGLPLTTFMYNWNGRSTVLFLSILELELATAPSGILTAVRLVRGSGPVGPRTGKMFTVLRFTFYVLHLHLHVQCMHTIRLIRLRLLSTVSC